MAAADALLVTVAELREAQREAVPSLDERSGLAERSLGAAQGALRSVLGYDPLIHKVARFRPRWRRHEACAARGALALEAEPSWAYGPGPAPIVRVDADPYRPSGQAAGYYTVAIGAGADVLEVAEGDELPPAVDLWVGWRGERHSLDGADGTVDLRALPGLSGLTALPPPLPDALRAAIVEGAVYVARRADRAGVVAVETDVGSQVRRVETLAAMNDVNTLIGRSPELVALMAVYAAPYRRYNV